MKKKIAFVIPSLRVGGSERVVVNIVKKINREKYQIRLIVIDYNGPFKKEIPNDVEIINLGRKRLRDSVVAIFKEILKFKPDYVFSTLGYLNFLLILLIKVLKLNTKIVVRESSTPSKYINNFSPLKKKLYSNLYKSLYPMADIIVAQCNSMQEDLVSNFNIEKNKVVTVYNPIDIESIKYKMKQKKPFDNKNINIVAVGRLVYAKGYDILLNSINLLSEKYPNIKLHILGDGPLKGDLIQLAKELNLDKKVNFLGFIENPYPYIGSADLYVLSSRWEGFPNTLLEAIACGTNVVATNCKSGPEEIIGDNNFGYLAKSEDPNSLYEVMDKALNEKKENQKRAEDFSINKIIKQYESLLDSL
ncbi:glycosyltransferase [Cytobacillus kochii]